MRKEVLFRLVAGFFAFFMLIIINCPASNADVAWEPDDNFYRRHADECRLVREKDLIANGPGGRVTVWQSPVSDREVDTIENGSEVYVEYTYTDKRGYEWGIIPLGGGKTGWVPMDYLITEPGLMNFIMKHRDEYQKYNDEFVLPEGVESICFWSYPGSGEVISVAGVDNVDSVDVTSSYTDKDGRQWGYVPYFRTMSGWICMSDPANDQIPVNEEDAADIAVLTEPTVIIKPQSDGTAILILAAVLFAAVVAGTVVLVRVMFRGKTAKTDPGKARDDFK